MLGYTKIQIIGNLGGIPDLKFLPSGDPVVNFSVAVNRRYKDREGNQKEATDWFRVCAFNGVGEALREVPSKGLLQSSSRDAFQVRQYNSKQNGKEVSVEIIPSTVRFLGFGRRREPSVRHQVSRPLGRLRRRTALMAPDEDTPF